MKINNKITNFFLVKRPETENKWWHRLFTVLLFGSTIFVLILTVYLSIGNNNHDWVANNITFNLEPNYKEAIGKEFPCVRSLFIKCNDVGVSSYDLDRYEKLWETTRDNLWEQTGLDNKYGADCIKKFGEKLTQFEVVTLELEAPTNKSGDEIICWRKVALDEGNDPAYATYENIIKNLPLTLKVSKDINYGFILSDLAYWIFVPIITVSIWVMFWSTIVYRSILYVVFGKKK